MNSTAWRPTPRSSPLVARVLGILRALAPESLLHIGAGGGSFRWSILDAFPALSITSLESPAQRVTHGLDFAYGAFDVTVAFDVLEHLEDPVRACRECVRVSRRYFIVSVPSQPDDNPSHLQLFSAVSLAKMLESAGAVVVSTEFVLGDIVAVARL